VALKKGERFQVGGEMVDEEKNSNDDDKHDSNESDDIDENACGPVDEPRTRRGLEMVIACMVVCA
jgi:hypothetical protein